MSNDLQMDEDGRAQPPTIPCGHVTRLEMLSMIQEDAYRYYRMWGVLRRQGSISDAVDLESAIDVMEDGNMFQHLMADITRNLTKARVKCKTCRSESKRETQPIAEQSPDIIPDQTPTSPSPPPSSPSSSESFASDHVVDRHTSKVNLPDHLKEFACMKHARHRPSQSTRRTRSSQLAPDLPVQRMKFLPDDLSFDDYYGGPTIEDCLDEPISNFPLNPYGVPTQRSCWEEFKDYGYRIQPSFALAFNIQDPVLVAEHILPDASKRQRLNDIPQQRRDHTSRSRKGAKTTVDVNDIVTLGLEEMLKRNCPEGSKRSMDAFLTGHNEERRFIKVDPERDGITLESDEVLTTIDIDSMIWVTHSLRFRQALKLFVLPHIGTSTPINHNNHVYVDILFPQSNRDKEDGPPRSEWFSRLFAVSTIPHTHFAHISSGAGSLSVYVMFPRMIHHNRYTGRNQTVIPYEVQSMWLTEVVLPAMVEATDRSFRPYVDFTLEEWKWKAAKHQGFSNTKSAPILADQLDTLQKAMRSIVKRSPDTLDLFGSFFFVCDIRGCNGTTHGDDPYESLKKEYPCMDWDYAMEREHGQLVLDLGITFHPNPVDQTPLVGLWRYDLLEPSYDNSGANKPKRYVACTMQDYGGLQATLNEHRSRVVQIRFLSTYMLSFESIRRPSIKQYFCADTDAYATSTEFHTCCKQYTSIYQGSRKKSFGVRHEIRASGPAAQVALSVAKAKVTFGSS